MNILGERLPLAAAVLAGGASRRMGRDKAGLRLGGKRLLDWQLERLRALAPAELLVSGREGVDYEVGGIRVVCDATPGLGPLGGIAAILAATTAPHVLVLAVDLPAMTEGFLQRLVARRRPEIGIVPRTAAGWEPLVAVFPRRIEARVRAHLAAGRLALQALVSAGEAAGELEALPVAAGEEASLLNWNRPEDWPPAGGDEA